MRYFVLVFDFVSVHFWSY